MNAGERGGSTNPQAPHMLDGSQGGSKHVAHGAPHRADLATRRCGGGCGCGWGCGCECGWLVPSNHWPVVADDMGWMDRGIRGNPN